MILIWDLLGLNPALSCIQGSLITSNIGDLAAEHRAYHQYKALHQVYNLAAAIKTPDGYPGLFVLPILQLCNYADNRGILPLYTVLTEAAKGQHLKVVQQLVNSTVFHY